MTEEWKSCPSFPDYEITRSGEIRRTDGSGVTVLERGKYRYAVIKTDRGHVQRSMDRLIQEAFGGALHSECTRCLKTLHETRSLCFHLPRPDVIFIENPIASALLKQRYEETRILVDRYLQELIEQVVEHDIPKKEAVNE